MVDFQSRDTRRSTREDDESDAETTDEQSGEADEDESAEETSARDAESIEYDADTGGDTLGYAVVTVAADGSLDADPVGDAAVDVIERVGDAVVTRELLAPSYDGIQQSIGALAKRSDVEAVVTAGGTGVEPTDVTVDAVDDLFEKRLPGFGELFRLLSHETEGTAVVRTRATAGIVGGVPVFCLPGDPGAVRRGTEEIVVAEAPKLAALAGDDGPSPASDRSRLL